MNDTSQQLVTAAADAAALTAHQAQLATAAVLRKIAELIDEDADSGWPDADDLVVLADDIDQKGATT